MKSSIRIKLAAILLCLATTGAGAASHAGKPSLAPSVTSPEAADKTVVIKDTTKYVNVYEDETVLFIVGNQQFAVKFDGHSYFYDLGTIAPAGMLNHKVRIYIGPNPADPWLERP